MTGSTFGLLTVLALTDSTSFGTLLIPIWLLLGVGRPRPARMLAYLATVTVFYLAVGVVLSLGAHLFLRDIQSWISTDAGAIVVTILGAGLLIASFSMAWRRKKAERRTGRGRLIQWRERVISAETGSALPLMIFALTATALEVSTMLPYLAAIGILSDADLPPASHGIILAGYCAVMILPALLLLSLRLLAHRAVDPLLQRINDWMTRSAGDWMPWIVGIIGVLLARHGLGHLGLLTSTKL